MITESTDARMLNNFISLINPTKSEEQPNLASCLIKALNHEVQNLSETTMQGFIQNLKNSKHIFSKKPNKALN